MSITLRVNGKEQTLDVDPEMPLLWAIRDVIGLTGTKYGCGQALCGACVIHLDGEAVRACVTPVRRAVGHAVTTIEGLGRRQPPAPARVGGARGAPVRLLPVGANHDRGGAPGEAAEAERRGDRSLDGGQHLPVRDVHAHPRRGEEGRRGRREPMSVVLVRRSFLAGLGLAVGGLALGIVGDAEAAGKTAQPKAVAAGGEPGLHANVFVHIAPDGVVSIVCHRSEMGQGVRSSLPVLIADELGADMAKVKILQADGDKVYGDQNTDGSSSVRKGTEELRKAGATARTMLIAAAAKRWKVKPETCKAYDHAVFHAKSARKLDFGELVAEAAKLPVPSGGDVKLRPDAELKHVGTELPLLDAPGIVKGAAIFGADVSLPGMLIAVVARPPVVGAKLARTTPRARWRSPA